MAPKWQLISDDVKQIVISHKGWAKGVKVCFPFWTG